MDQQSDVTKAIDVVLNGSEAFCKFLSANDTGKTSGHQSGIYIPKDSISILFAEPGKKGANIDKWVRIRWSDNFETTSRFIYYGKKTRNEYRITRLPTEIRNPENTGDLFILVKHSPEDYSAFLLSREEDIEGFLAAFNMAPTDTNRLIPYGKRNDDLFGDALIRNFLNTYQNEFPGSIQMSAFAQELLKSTSSFSTYVDRDTQIINLIKKEYMVFRELEKAIYMPVIQKGFRSMDTFLELSNTILNRRKSQAGKSLELHLKYIFTENRLKFISQPHTENKNRPDFIFPDEASYHNLQFPSDKLAFLAAKTTCKDRWRQILTEANRIKRKHLFTLQQGISDQQIDEMYSNGITLVIPQDYHSTFSEEKRGGLWNLTKFIEYIKEKQTIG